MSLRPNRRIATLALGGWALAALAGAQEPEPRAAPRRLSFGGEALASLATGDDGYFDYSSYEQSALRLDRARLDTSLRLGAHVALLGELRADNGDGLAVSGLYLRLHPWTGRAVDVQVGRIPPVFGAFARHAYGADNPLIGLPLAYQYLTSLRSDALPTSVDDVLRMRGRGWLSRYPIGSPGGAPGLPLVAGDRWDTGLEVRLGRGTLGLSGALTSGTLSNPRVDDDNGGKQVSGRLEVRPTIGLVLGASVARGEYLADTAADVLPAPAAGGPYTQRALGLDAEFSRGYWIVRSEWILSEWRVPLAQSPARTLSLRASGVFVEARYKIRPGLYAAARGDHLGFNRVTGSLFGGRPTSWDAPVSRVEAGGGFSFRRNLSLKAVFQHNWRDSGAYRSESLVAVQALAWF